MAIALLNSVATGLFSGGGASSAIDTSGATLLTICASWFTNGTGLTISDSKGNTYTPLSSQVTAQHTAAIYYCANPIVGTGHTFSVTGTTVFPGWVAQAWSTVKTSSPFDQQNGANNGGTSLASGSVTPSEDNELILTFSGFEAVSTETVSSPFSTPVEVNYDPSNHFGAATAYEIQTTATPRNSTWSGSNTARTSVIGTFKAAAAGAKQQMMMLLGMGG